MSKIRNIEDIVDWQLCLGCGACSYICPQDQIKLIDILETGIRPERAVTASCNDCNDCLQVCPSHSVDFGELKRHPDYQATVDKKTESNWGAIVGIWEGFASDREIRFKASSGGALTAISQYCIEKGNHDLVLHIGEDPNDPVRNRTRVSKTKKELLDSAGSRYSPASVCDGLNIVEEADSPCVVIGKPAEIAAIRKAAKLRPKLKQKLGVTLSFFCAETPPTQATLKLIEKLSVSRNRITMLRYRGYGWPGHFTTREGNDEPKKHWTYQKSWAYLQKYRPWGVHLWPDGAGELADISCGDPWYEEPNGINPGFSLIVARTAIGKAIVEGAIKNGYLSATPAESWKLEKSQENLLKKKGATWGRRLTQSLFGIPNTEIKNLDLYGPWLELTISDKIKSTIGTARRIIRRKLYKSKRSITI